jgi:hypothetical protein
MVKVLAGLIAAIVIAVGAFFGLQFYVQQRAVAEVDAAFADLRAGGAKATHGKVSFDLWSRTLTVPDISWESAGQPPQTVKLGRVVASGVSQPEAGRFAAERVDASDIEVSAAITAQAAMTMSYTVPRLEVVNYAGPAAPLRRLESTALADVYRFMLDHFAAASASSITAPTVTVKSTGLGGGRTPATADYVYSNVVARDLKGGKIASTTIDKVNLAFSVEAAGKREGISGEMEKLAAYDFDATAAAAMLDPARAKDDNVHRFYRQLTAGAYTLTLGQGVKVRLGGMTLDEVGLRPSKLQFATLMEIVESAPPPGTTPTPAQLRELLEKVASIYEGLYLGGFEARSLSVETPGEPFRIAAVRFGKLDNGKLAEFAIEGLDAHSPKQGPVKVGRFALKSVDLANLMRIASQLGATAGRTPPPEQLAALLTVLDGGEISGLVAPYKNTGQPVTIDTFNLSWGQFVGPIPTRARTTVKMTGPVDLSDPDPFKMLASAGMKSATIIFDLGAGWTEAQKTFALEPATLEVGGLFTAALRASVGNVPREVFSINPLQAVIMAAQIEVGPLELALRDTGGVDLAVAQFARTQNMGREEARQAIIQNIRETGMKLSGANADAMAIAGAIARFVELPGGTLSIKLTPRGKVPVMQIADTLKTNPMLALARFQVDAGNGR